MTACFIALGSNLNQPTEQLRQACKALQQLPQSQLVAFSRCYGSKAIGPGDQPDYINAAVLLETELAPLDLLEQLQNIEDQQLRVRTERWGPRTLDLDLLLYGTQSIDLPTLTVPHPRMMERNFVLYPLADINPDLHFPDGTSLASRLDYCPRDGLTVIAAKLTTETPLDDSGNH